MLNFYVISTGHDMVNDTGSSTTCRSIFKAPPIKKITKCEVRSENKTCTKKPLDDFRPKIQNFNFWP